MGSKGLVHPSLIQHLQWLSTLSLLAPISLPQVSATVHRPQTALYPFDFQSQSAAEANKPDWTGRGQAGQLEAVIFPPASGRDARAGPWVTLLLSLQMAGDRDFVPLLITWWSGTGKRELRLWIWSCAQTLGGSKKPKQSCISLQLRAESAVFFADLAETALHFGSISVPWGYRVPSRQERASPTVSLPRSPQAGRSQQHHSRYRGAVPATWGRTMPLGFAAQDLFCSCSAGLFPTTKMGIRTEDRDSVSISVRKAEIGRG